jgi:hypothetical protein
MTNQTAVKITSIADVQPMVVPISATQNKCIVTFRAQVDGEWITAEGESVGPNHSVTPIFVEVPWIKDVPRF